MSKHSDKQFKGPRSQPFFSTPSKNDIPPLPGTPAATAAGMIPMPTGRRGPISHVPATLESTLVMPAIPVTPDYSGRGGPITSVSTMPALPALPGMRKPLTTKEIRLQDRVRYYKDWLAKQARYDAQRDRQKEINDYVEEATRPAKFRGTDVAIFAPFRPALSALQTFTSGQFVGLSLLGLLWLAGLYFFQLRMLTAVLAAATVLYVFCLLLDLTLALRSFRSAPEEQIDDEIVHALKRAEWPMYTILCPLYREAQVVPQFVQSMQALDYPEDKLQILFLTEENDAETRNAIRALALPPHFRILVVPDGQPRTKPRACNYGLLYTEGTYVVIYDAEDEPDPLQLKKAVLTFANHNVNVACVQAKLNFYNVRQNVLTRWFTAEYSAWFDLILPGLQLAGFSLPLGGTSNHFRVDTLRALGAWDAYNVTEDCDLGLRLKRFKLETVILDSTTLEEANPQLKNWIRQRSRWIKGYMQTYLVYMRHPLEIFRKGQLYEMFSFQIVVGSGTGVMLLNPFMWILLGLYLIFGNSVINVYHVLFPGPILYLSAFCLLFGNFFYIYVYLLACTKRKLYHLLPWTLFIPIYWLLMSIAAFFALYELLVRPHYWQKTVHGLHVKKKQAQPQARSKSALAMLLEEPTMSLPTVPGTGMKLGAVPSVSMSLQAMPTQMTPAISFKQKQAQTTARSARVRDLWLVALIGIACITSIVACWYSFEHHYITLYDDALSHMRISRSVFDNLTPGLAQLGAVWLPLPHILMWPFIWNDYLWRTGLAGSFAAMPCYVIAAIYIYLSARKLTNNSAASFIGTLAFVFNPNVLYLQSTPLSETVCMATLAMSGYYFLCWIESQTFKSLVATAICVFLATLARYDGWVLCIGIFVCIALVGLVKRQRFWQITGNLMIFGILGGMGIGLWLAWNAAIFGDPFYFQHSTYSSQTQQAQQLQINHLFAYHNLWQAIRFYAVDFAQNVGLILCVLAAIALIWFLLKRRWKAETFGALVFLAPLAVYIFSLYNGQAIIWIPGANPSNLNLVLYNVRYGAQMVVPVALFLAILAAQMRMPSHKHIGAFVQLVLIGIVAFQFVLTSSQGIISLQEGENYYSCEAQSVATTYLAQHYNGGKILEFTYTTKADPTQMNVEFQNIIYEGSGVYWKLALQNPVGLVDWIFVNPTNKDDLVAQYINVNDPTFLTQFSLVAKNANGVLLFHRIGAPLLPLHQATPIWNVPHQDCSQFISSVPATLPPSSL